MNKPLPPLPPRPEPLKGSTPKSPRDLGTDKNFNLPERPGKNLNKNTPTLQVFNYPSSAPQNSNNVPSVDVKTPENTNKKKFPVKLTAIIAASVLVLGVSSFGVSQFLNSLTPKTVTAIEDDSLPPSEDPYSSMTDEEVDETLENMESIDEDLDTLEGLLAPRTQQPFPTSTYRSVPLDPNDEHDATFKRVLDSLATPSVYSLEQLKAAVLDACVMIADGASKEQYYDWVYSLEDPVEFMEASSLGYRHYCPASNDIFVTWL